jgi:heme exporter protein A
LIAGLNIEGLALERGGRRLFSGLSLALAAGEAVALTGANGSGKTSLLRAIAGFLRPAEGEIRFDGATGGLDAGEARRGGLHLVGHHDGLKLNRPALEELEFQARWTGADPGAARNALEVVGLSRAAGLDVRLMSAGQKRRLALARLVASPRPLWLLDEPFAPLDAASRELFGRLMTTHLATGGLVLAAVHDPLPIPARGLEIGA